MLCCFLSHHAYDVIAASVPEAPEEPSVDTLEEVSSAADSIVLSTRAPQSNGSPITKYQASLRLCGGAGDGEEGEEEEEERPAKWVLAGTTLAAECTEGGTSSSGSSGVRGSAVSFCVQSAGVQSGQWYTFRVRACNSIGWSQWSTESQPFKVQGVCHAHCVYSRVHSHVAFCVCCGDNRRGPFQAGKAKCDRVQQSPAGVVLASPSSHCRVKRRHVCD